MGYVRSSPLPAIEVESLYPPFNMRCRWLADKFLLKSLSFSNCPIFDTFYSLFLTCRYVSKSLPILALTANSISPFHQYVLTNFKHPMHEIRYDVLLYSTHVHIADISPGFSSLDLRNSSPFIECNFTDFIVIYTDGSVSTLSAGYSFYITELHISCTSNLLPSSSSFTAKCFAIVEALNFISTSPYKKFLIVLSPIS